MSLLGLLIIAAYAYILWDIAAQYANRSNGGKQ